MDGTLERLSVIGREITTHLDAAAVFGLLDRHIHSLLPTRTFAIYLVDVGAGQLRRAFGVDNGEAMAPEAIALNDTSAAGYPMQCLTEQRELCVELWPKSAPDDSTSNLSALFIPLMAGARAIGVMTVQAPLANAYGPNERLIFRTLCAYGAIALDNADAYRQLQQAQSRLAEQERLAALGALMAGVAHELNTPIGNSLLIASTLEHHANALAAQLDGPGLRRSELASFIAATQAGAALLMRALGGAADLVNSFKQVAVDRTSEQRRQFSVTQVCHELIATMMNRIRAAGHEIIVDGSEAVLMDSYPGPLGQVIANLINNALLHAFAPGQRGRITLSCSSVRDERVQISCRDNGTGIAPEHLKRIFDPFFTTRLGQGGSGLGLSISYNLVTAVLGGQIMVHSSEHDGTCVTLDLPHHAPNHQPLHLRGQTH